MQELCEGAAARDEGMDVDEFLTWAAYWSLEPPIETRLDAQTAMLQAQAYNMNRGKGKPAKPAKAFYPRWYEPPAPPEKQMERNLAALRANYLAMRGNPDRL